MRPDERIAELSAALHECQSMQPAALAMIRKEGYVMHGDGSGHTAAEFEMLAFSLYTYLAEINTICREVLEEDE